MPSPDEVRNLIESAGGKVNEMGALPDNSGFAIASFPLREDHWIYAGTKEDVLNGYVKHESYGQFNVPPMIFRMGAKEKAALTIGTSDESSLDAGIEGRGVTMTKKAFADAIRTAGRYAVRCATMNGKEMDFDPDALLQNLVVGFLGYWTEDGLDHEDEWANPTNSNSAKGQGPRRVYFERCFIDEKVGRGEVSKEKLGICDMMQRAMRIFKERIKRDVSRPPSKG